MADSESAADTPKRKNLTTSEKRAMIAELLKGSNNGKLFQGDFKRVAAMYQQHPRTYIALSTMFVSPTLQSVWPDCCFSAFVMSLL